MEKNGESQWAVHFAKCCHFHLLVNEHTRLALSSEMQPSLTGEGTVTQRGPAAPGWQLLGGRAGARTHALYIPARSFPLCVMLRGMALTGRVKGGTCSTGHLGPGGLWEDHGQEPPSKRGGLPGKGAGYSPSTTHRACGASTLPAR